MRTLHQLFLFITLILPLFVGCGNNPTSNERERQAFGAANRRNIVVIDDLALRGTPIAVDTANLDTTQVVIWSSVGMINGAFERDSTNDHFVIRDENNTEYEVNFPVSLDTLTLSTLEVYYALPAVMDEDTVRVLVPRRYMIPTQTNNNGGNGGNNGSGNSNN